MADDAGTRLLPIHHCAEDYGKPDQECLTERVVSTLKRALNNLLVSLMPRQHQHAVANPF
jgi:hypothetical protein